MLGSAHRVVVIQAVGNFGALVEPPRATDAGGVVAVAIQGKGYIVR